MNTENPKIVSNLTALSALVLAVCSGGLSLYKGVTLGCAVKLNPLTQDLTTCFSACNQINIITYTKQRLL
jgi:hypothetical protein